MGGVFGHSNGRWVRGPTPGFDGESHYWYVGIVVTDGTS